MTESSDRPQLEMTWPAERVDDPPPVVLPEGYALRTWREGDEAGYVALMASAGFDGWTPARIAQTRRSVLPGGLFLVEAPGGGRPVATAMAVDCPTDRHPRGGELGWVAVDPAHRGRRLGQAVSAVATARLLAAGYRDVYLLTDDHRLPAIKTYLRMGFRPLRWAEGMDERWRAVLDALGWPGPEGP
jgi:mycothiol synthase